MDILQWSMFDEDLVEVTTEEVRYIVRRNPQRAEELAAVVKGSVRAWKNT
jgi:hypothetical protein